MDADTSPEPLIKGGGQESLHRAGTENTAAIAGFGAAVSDVYSMHDADSIVEQLRNNIEQGVEEISRQSSNNTPLPVFHGAASPRLDNTTCFAVEGIKAENALIALDLAGIYVSSGSACSSGRVNQSHVLSAMGVSPEQAECTLRISIGKQTTNEQAGHFLNTWKNIVENRA
jgi:cysteine desulfurase